MKTINTANTTCTITDAEYEKVVEMVASANIEHAIIPVCQHKPFDCIVVKAMRDNDGKCWIDDIYSALANDTMDHREMAKHFEQVWTRNDTWSKMAFARMSDAAATEKFIKVCSFASAQAYGCAH